MSERGRIITPDSFSHTEQDAKAEPVVSPQTIVTAGSNEPILNKKIDHKNLKNEDKAVNDNRESATKTATQTDEPLKKTEPAVTTSARAVIGTRRTAARTEPLTSDTRIAPPKVSSLESTELTVLSEYLSNEAHVKAEQALKEETRKTTLALQNFSNIQDSNNKEAEKKKRENEDFIAAINLVELENEVRLFLYFARVIENILEAAREEEQQFAEQRTERLALINGETLKYPTLLPMPDKVITDEKSTMHILETAKTVLHEIAVKREQITERMMDKDHWGADNWDEGWALQTKNLHNTLAEKREDFANVIIQNDPDKALTKDQEVTLYSAFDKINDAIQQQLLEAPPPSPVIEHDDSGDIIIGAEAPDVSHLPLPVHIHTFPANMVYKSQLQQEIELGAIHAAIKGYGEVKEKDKDIIEEKAIGGNAKYDANSNIRLAVRYAAKIAGDIKCALQKGMQFVQDKSTLNTLKELEEKTREQVEEVKAMPTLSDTAPRFNRN